MFEQKPTIRPIFKKAPSGAFLYNKKDINKENESLKDVKAMNRKEISNVKSLHPWRKTKSLFFKKRKFLFCSYTQNISLEKLFNLL